MATIYKIKRFNYYSQKEFGIFGNFRNKIAKKLDNSAEQDVNDSLKSFQNLRKMEQSHKRNPQVIKNLLKRSKQEGLRVMKNIPAESNKLITNKGIKDIEDSIEYSKKMTELFGLEDPLGKDLVRKANKIKNERNKGKEVVNLVDPYHTATIAHETGHKVAKNKFPGKYLKRNRDTIKGQIMTLLDEDLATKEGLKIMKESGASKEELKDAKLFLKEARKTYKKNLDSSVKKKLSKLIKPKNRL